MDVHALVTDELWANSEPLLSPPPPPPPGGNDWQPERPTRCEISSILQEGSGWNKLPLAPGCGSGSTCRRRFQEWRAAGGWPRLHRVLLARRAGAGALDWSRVRVASARVPAKRGARDRPNPTDRGKPGTTHHLAVERGGLPLAAGLRGADRPAAGRFAPLLAAIPPARGRRGRPRRRPGKVHADKADDGPPCRRSLRRLGIGCRSARKGVGSKARLGRYRGVAERTLACLHRCKRLLVRYERLEEHQQACLDLGGALSCFRFVQRLE